MVTPSIASKIFGTFQMIVLQRKMLLRYQSQKVRALAIVFMKTLRAGPGKAIKKFLEVGGGTTVRTKY